MTIKRIAALRTAGDFRAHCAALGVELPFDAAPLQPPPLLHVAALEYRICENFPHNGKCVASFGAKQKT